MANESIFSKMKPPTPVEKEDESSLGPAVGYRSTDIVARTDSNVHGDTILLLEEARNTVVFSDENDETNKVILHINKAIRILNRLKKELELKKK